MRTKKYIFVAYITTKSGKRIYAKNYGYKVFRYRDLIKKEVSYQWGKLLLFNKQKQEFNITLAFAMAEGKGFEPLNAFDVSRFQDARLRPLRPTFHKNY